MTFKLHNFFRSSTSTRLRAVGLGSNRLLRVPYLITAFLMVVNLLVVGYLQPLSRYYYQQLQFVAMAASPSTATR